VIVDPVYGFQAVNVEAALRTSTSFLHWMRRLIAARKRQSRVFGRGDLRFLRPVNTRVLAHLRMCQGRTVLAVHNLAASAEPVELDLSEFRGAVPVEMLGGSRFPAIGEQPYFLSLAPYGFYWFEMRRPGGQPEAYGIEGHAI
jgi:maltose alpha-D-glucosyltransferase/alpha-amylase